MAAQHNKNRCKKCCSYTAYDTPLARISHVEKHANITRYECSTPGCNYSTPYKQVMKTHNEMHPDKIGQEIFGTPLTTNESIILKQVWMECFPDKIDDFDVFCHVCHANVKSRMPKHRKEHAFNHLKIEPYQCPQQGCDFRANHQTTLRIHLHRKHNRRVAEAKLMPTILTAHQEIEVEDMVKRCFPNVVVPAAPPSQVNPGGSPSNPQFLQLLPHYPTFGFLPAASYVVPSTVYFPPTFFPYPYPNP